uniref:Globin 2, isoform D n=1 Tax=Drosophila melanogaster TaxID=7227 RepID=A0A0B4KGM9_DROME|nr:globin 2, isoform D [Drosophila melanogaster]AGB95705.1 globin 2, isoform D [Drosophila melanogaster]|eukprot:NP_001262322.1 globin 2, isoform D [Drosophila melanogaster]
MSQISKLTHISRISQNNQSDGSDEDKFRRANFPVYPKPLPDRDLSYKADENEFTMVEKASLRNAWRLIEPFQRRFGKENFYRKDGKINLSKLHGHAMAMMKLMSKLVQTLDCNLAFRLALDENLPTHLKNGIDPDYMRMLATALKSYILASSVIENHNSCSLSNGLARLVEIVGEYAVVDEARKRAMSTALRTTVDDAGNRIVKVALGT